MPSWTRHIKKYVVYECIMEENKGLERDGREGSYIDLCRFKINCCLSCSHDLPVLYYIIYGLY